MNLTPEGEQKYQEQFGSKFSNMNGEESDIEQVVNPTKNIVEENKNGETEMKNGIKAFGKSINVGKNSLLPSKKNPNVRRWQREVEDEIHLSPDEKEDENASMISDEIKKFTKYQMDMERGLRSALQVLLKLDDDDFRDDPDKREEFGTHYHNIRTMIEKEMSKISKLK